MYDCGDPLKNLFTFHYYIVVISQTIMFTICMIIDNPTFVDFSWCFNHLVIGTSILVQNNLLDEPNIPFVDKYDVFNYPKNYLGYILLVIWFCRLGGFILFTRIFTKHIDPRYQGENEKPSFLKKLITNFLQFQFQGFLSTLTALPLFYMFDKSEIDLNWWNYIGLVMAIIGIIGEAIADSQLQSFKNKKMALNKKMKQNPQESDLVEQYNKLPKTYNQGLFTYCRHPNLFFELIFWNGMFILALNKDLCSLVGVIGPAFLWIIMFFLTIPLTTKHMLETRPNYEQFIKNSNTFCPF